MWSEPENYASISWVFLRLLGVIFFLAQGAFLLQAKGLIGKGGILPLDHYMQSLKRQIKKHRFWKVPTIFWVSSSNRFIEGTLCVGVMASLLLIMGIFSPAMILILTVIQISLIYAGQDFMSFGWELFLVEIGINSFFISLSDVPNPLVFLSINFLLFRFHIQAGAVKIQSHDPNWKNLTALYYHYQSQPLPNLIAWVMHKMPLSWHKASCVYMFFVELVVPFGIFMGDEIRFFVFTQFFLLQFFIAFTGNFSYLNYMTVVLSLILIPDSFLPQMFEKGIVENPSLIMESFLYCAGFFLFGLQVVRLADHFFPNRDFRRILSLFSPFFIVNRYGIFAVMTTERIEIVIEGSDNGVDWKEYAFKYKPSEIGRRPRWIAPYQPRLDWQAWFLPFTSFHDEIWFQRFLICLLKGEKDVLSLVRVNPFPENPPQLMRALAYEYQFTSWKEKRESGNWWKRKHIGSYTPPITF